MWEFNIKIELNSNAHEITPRELTQDTRTYACMHVRRARFNKFDARGILVRPQRNVPGIS